MMAPISFSIGGKRSIENWTFGVSFASNTSIIVETGVQKDE
jgi:hypothetical protein